MNIESKQCIFEWQKKHQDEIDRPDEKSRPLPDKAERERVGDILQIQECRLFY